MAAPPVAVSTHQQQTPSAPTMWAIEHQMSTCHNKTDKHNVQPAPSDKYKNCFRCYRLEKVQRQTFASCLTCKKHFCFRQKRNCLLLDHVYENDNLNDSFTILSTSRK